MLYFVFTIDGNWKEYFDAKLSDHKRFPKEKVLLDLVQREIDTADKILKGRFVHFVHTSPRVRDFFLEKGFRKLWKELVKNNGDTGLHCHEDDPYKRYYYHDASMMEHVISKEAENFRKAGLDIRSYRSGFLGFSDAMVKILEDNEIFFDFSCEPGRYLKQGDNLISDWRGAPESHYRMSYNNRCKPGDSKVWEIPVGTSKGKYLYFEKSNPKEIEKISLDLKAKSVDNRGALIVSVLSHTYEFESREKINDIERNLTILKKYGSFINIEELGCILS